MDKCNLGIRRRHGKAAWAVVAATDAGEIVRKKMDWWGEEDDTQGPL
jgi:hypothetical protein